jgi:hypothetical protein
MNALQHGCDAAPENEAAVMRALGEDPERYAALQRELSTAYGLGDALWDRQLADLSKLYWRRNRIERMETGLMRRALQAVEARQRARQKEIARGDGRDRARLLPGAGGRDLGDVDAAGNGARPVD